MSVLLDTPYSLDERRMANWTQAQEKTISTEYPFLTQNEAIEQYVARTYLQFLWLPESIMPLQLIVPSLRRVNAPSSSSNTSVHPLHALLEPLLLDTRSVDNKYHTELPLILSEGGGAGEMEETMMWYSLSHEKGDESHQDNPWSDETWKQGYMERMEKREVQIQILLLLFKLSLPGPHPPVPVKKKRKRSKKAVEPVLTTEEHLEAFMDKLSVWQLTESVERSTNKNEEHDWAQEYTENIVEPLFKTQLPELCALLRGKVFPSSPFSDTESNATDVSPELPKRTLTRVPPSSQVVSPTLSTRSTSKALSRSRSRSLSISLAQEQKERERMSNLPAKKPAFSREVSMSRVFKPKPKPTQAQPKLKGTLKSQPPPPPVPKPSHDHGVTLVEETPAKPRPHVKSLASTSLRTSSLSLSFTKSSSRLNLTPVPESPPIAQHGKDDDDIDDGEEEWMMDSSPPDIVFLNPKRDAVDSADEDERDRVDPTTPCRSSRKRRR